MPFRSHIHTWRSSWIKKDNPLPLSLDELVDLPWQYRFKQSFPLAFQSSLHSNLILLQNCYILGKRFGCDMGSFWLQKSCKTVPRREKKKSLYWEDQKDIKAKLSCTETELGTRSPVFYLYFLPASKLQEFFPIRQRTLLNCKGVLLQALCGNIFSPFLPHSPYIISA